MKIDYHIHTNCSDGVYSILEILNLIQKNDIQQFSITDHDSIESISILSKLLPASSAFIPGMEITCAEYTLKDFPYPFSIHLLGYHFDSHNPYLIAALESRKKRVENTFCNLLKEISLVVHQSLSLQDIPISCGIVMQLCDIQEYVRLSFPEYYEQLVPMIHSYAVPLSDSNISIKEGIDLIHNAGGKAVWAHPYHIYHRFQKRIIELCDVEIILKELLSLGLDGIEANYLDFSMEQRNCLQKLAHTHHLLITSGSDFHGSIRRSRMGVDELK